MRPACSLNPAPLKAPNSPHFREKLPDAVTLPQHFRTNGWFAARVGKLYHYGVPLQIGTGGLDDYLSWDLAINPRGRDREIHDKIFSLRSGQFGATLSWLADGGPDAEHTDGIAAAEAVRLLERFKRTGESFFSPSASIGRIRRMSRRRSTSTCIRAIASSCRRCRIPIVRMRRKPRAQRVRGTR